MEIKSGRGYVYSIQYHIVWCVKYRHKILNDKLETRLIELLKQIASDNNFFNTRNKYRFRPHSFANRLYSTALYSRYD